MLQPSDEATDGDDSGIEDDRLRLMFTCCHPALPVEAQVALTLRTLAGLTTPEIARAFLVPARDDGQAADPREAQDHRGANPVPGARRTPSRRAAPRRARGDLRPVQRGLRRQRGRRADPQGPVRRGDPARTTIGRADARRARGARAAQPHAPTGLTTSRPRRDHRRARDARGPGPEPVGQARNRGRMHSARPRRTTSTAWALPVAGGDRCLPCAGSERR